MANDTGHCKQLLTDLNQEYERSRIFLEQLEESLRAVPVTTIALVPAASSRAGAPEESVAGDRASSSAVNSSNGKLGLQQLFTRKSLNLTSGQPQQNNEDEPATRRPPVVNFCSKKLDGVLTKALPRRAASFYQKRSPGLQPLIGLPRRPSQDSRQMHQQLEEMDLQRRISVSDESALSSTQRRPRASSQVFPNIRFADQSQLAPSQASPSLPGIGAQPSHFLQPHRQSDPSHAALANALQRGPASQTGAETAFVSGRDNSLRQRNHSRLGAEMFASSPQTQLEPASPSSSLASSSAQLPGVQRRSSSRLAPSRGPSNVSSAFTALAGRVSAPLELLLVDDSESDDTLADSDTDVAAGSGDEQQPSPMMPGYPMYKAAASGGAETMRISDCSYAVASSTARGRRASTTVMSPSAAAAISGATARIGSPIGSPLVLQFPTVHVRRSSTLYSQPGSPTGGRPMGGAGAAAQRPQLPVAARDGSGDSSAAGVAAARRRIMRGRSVELLPYMPYMPAAGHEARRLDVDAGPHSHQAITHE